MFASLALFYLAQSSQSATKNYKAREFELKKQGLEHSSYDETKLAVPP
ncbi:hypothetical protein HY065_02760 [Candidatus Berkelbacteria bacterium]|nr:hypothetical protein [Candidatus Berkelbacteria bacterium]